MGAPGTGKCVTGETRLLTQKGLMRIDDVPKYFAVNKDNTVEGLGIVTLDPKDLEFHEATASHWYHLGEQATVQITTDTGVSLEGTKEHPVVVVDESSGNLLFRRLDEIKEGDFVAVACNTNRFGSYTKIPSPDVAYLMGVLTGDGCLTIRNRVTLSSADNEVVDRVQDIAHTVLDATFSKTSSRPYDYEMSNAVAKGRLIEWGLSETYAEGKRIPEWIRMAPKEYVTAYLRGLFDTDGCAEKRGNVNISSASESLIADIQMMLLNVGIVARSYSRKKKYNGKNQFYLAIYGDFVEQFQREVGFTIKRKQKVLEETCARQRNTNVNYVPHQSGAIQTVWKHAVATTALTLDRAFYGESLYKNTKRYINAERSPSIVGMNRFLDGVMHIAPQVRGTPEIAHLKRLSSGQFFFTQVKQIEQSMKQVYDLTVPHTHNFVANGIINHNTLLARAVAGEAAVPFFHLSGSEFVEMFVGVGASRVRDLFKMAKKAAPAIIFVDEIDAVGRVRGGGVGGGNDEREQTLNQILVEMDGFEPSEKVIVMAATNRPDVLDPALLRPGRFDRRVTLDLPDREGREEILNIHARKKPLAEDVNLKVVAERTPGFSGADLASLMNEGAILAAREDRKTVAQYDLIRAIEKVMLGPERKSHILSKEEKKITAYHEAGHALVASVLPHADPVHKISIIARGNAGGYTLKLPLEETRLQSRKEFFDDIAMSLGGYVAEEMVFGDITTGPSNDLQVATALARDMVTKYGMSEKLGPVALEGFGGRALFGGRGVDSRDYSEDVSAKIDAEVSKIMNDAFARAREACTTHRKALDAIAEELVLQESIEREEFEKILIANGIIPKKKKEEAI
ncbi:MAG: ATP-dependent zinc metalloprotease FtsH [Minisyncoccia bacterium]